MENQPEKKGWLDNLVLIVVVLIALVVIGLSLQNTVKLARELSLNPYLTAGLVELLFASLLFIRGRQRAVRRAVPWFLSTGYFASLFFVTGVNIWGLYQESPIVGPIVGVTISGAMWLMESILVWMWTDSHLPYEKSVRELKREAKREIKKMRIMQQIEWMRSEAQKPDLALIEKARKADEKRAATIQKGLPAYFDPAGSVQSEDHESSQDIESSDQSIIDQPNNQSSNQDNVDQTIINQSSSVEQEPIDQPQSSEQADQIDQAGDQSNNQAAIGQESINRSSSDQPAIKRSSIRSINQPFKIDQALAAKYPLKEAIDYYEKHGEIPTQRGLAELADTTQHRAMMANRWLRKQVEASQTQLKLVKSS